MDEQGRGPSHTTLLELVVVVIPMMIDKNGEAITECISKLPTPIVLLLLSIVLLVTIQFLLSGTSILF